MRVKPNHYDTVSWSSSLTGSYETLYIHPRELELPVKDRMCDPGPSCFMVRYIDVDDARNSSRFSVKTPWNSGGMYQRHARNFSLYPTMPYPHASDHSLTVGAVNTILFIGALFDVTHWRILSRVGGPAYANTGDVVGPIYYPLL